MRARGALDASCGAGEGPEESRALRRLQLACVIHGQCGPAQPLLWPHAAGFKVQPPLIWRTPLLTRCLKLNLGLQCACQPVSSACCAAVTLVTLHCARSCELWLCLAQRLGRGRERVPLDLLAYVAQMRSAFTEADLYDACGGLIQEQLAPAAVRILGRRGGGGGHGKAHCVAADAGVWACVSEQCLQCLCACRWHDLADWLCRTEACVPACVQPELF